MSPLDRDYRHLWHPFTASDEWFAQENLVIASGQGAYLYDTEGRRYLDGTSSLWCNIHGHRHPALDAAVRAQLDRVAHSTLLGLTHEPAIHLAERLAALSGLDRCFYSDSGSTAVEVALKMAFQASQQRGDTQRTRFAALAEAYHGDTVGAVSLGGIDLFHAVYRPLLFDAVRIPSPDLSDPADEARCLDAARALFAEHGATVCALVVEPRVQGAAGLRTHSEAFMVALANLARAHGAFVVADEVATGFGRTGVMFASAPADPDFLCLGKAISGGYLPLAATLTRESVHAHFRGPYATMRTFFHGHTYTGNPLATAAAIASLDIFRDERVLDTLPAKVEALGAALAGLDHPWVDHARQAGMIAAVALAPPASAGERVAHRVALGARRHGAILRCLGDRVMVVPPLCARPDQLAVMVEALGAAIQDQAAVV
jgi:adenosylmethionine-8-amino-7-oxononanoate aminotransferase